MNNEAILLDYLNQRIINKNTSGKPETLSENAAKTLC